jgi:hypothetical protein
LTGSVSAAGRGRRGLVPLLLLFLAASPAAQPRPGESLIDRTLAIVGGAAITRSDVDLALSLGLIDPPSSPADRPVARLIDRWLMLQEVARFAPPEPDPAAVEARLAAVRRHAGSAEALAAVLARAGVSIGRIQNWIRDDLRIAAYLDQRFASAVLPTDAEIDEYARLHADELAPAANAPGGVAAAARDRLLLERRQALIADWVADLRRRTEVVEFPPA